MTPFRRALPLLACLLSVWILCAGCERTEPGAAGEGSPGLEARIARLEQQMAAQAKQHAEERQLMVQALESSTQRLDVVVEALIAGKVGTPATGSPAGSPFSAGNPTSVGRGVEQPPAGTEAPLRIGDEPGPTARGAETTGGDANDGDSTDREKTGETATGGWFQGTTLEGIDLVQVLVIFLAVALLSLVIVILFFPSRLRGTVPQVEYAALEEEAIEGLQDDLVPGPAADLPRADVVAPGPSPFHPGPRDEDLDIELPTGPDAPYLAGQLGSPRANLPVPAHEGEPVPHEITLAVQSQDEVHSLAEVLDHYLTTEPYILNEPKPQVALDEDVLHLRFFALPNLTETEHALLDDAVRRLRPRSTTARIVG